MSKDLIDRLLDNRVTGFNLDVAAVEAANLIEAQAAQIEMLLESIERCRNWFETQARVVSKGGPSSWEMMLLRDEQDALETVLATTPNEALQAFAAISATKEQGKLAQSTASAPRSTPSNLS